MLKLVYEWGQHLRDQAPLIKLNFQLLKLVYLVITIGKQRVVLRRDIFELHRIVYFYAVLLRVTCETGIGLDDDATIGAVLVQLVAFGTWHGTLILVTSC